LGWFDLDNLGAKAGQQKAAILGRFVADLDHSQPRKHPRK
jgi:hypothetical protein